MDSQNSIILREVSPRLLRCATPESRGFSHCNLNLDSIFGRRSVWHTFRGETQTCKRKSLELTRDLILRRRNPHEVLFSKRPRYAITTWYYDGEEREQALAGAEGGGGEGGSAEMEVEAERIRREIQKFESGGGIGGKKQPEEKGGAKGGGVEMVSDTSIKGVVEIAQGGDGKKAVQVDLEELD
jgi:hypothetical protein